MSAGIEESGGSTATMEPSSEHHQDPKDESIVNEKPLFKQVDDSGIELDQQNKISSPRPESIQNLGRFSDEALQSLQQELIEDNLNSHTPDGALKAAEQLYTLKRTGAVEFEGSSKQEILSALSAQRGAFVEMARTGKINMDGKEKSVKNADAVLVRYLALIKNAGVDGRNFIVSAEEKEIITRGLHERAKLIDQGRDDTRLSQMCINARVAGVQKNFDSYKTSLQKEAKVYRVNAFADIAKGSLDSVFTVRLNQSRAAYKVLTGEDLPKDVLSKTPEKGIDDLNKSYSTAAIKQENWAGLARNDAFRKFMDQRIPPPRQANARQKMVEQAVRLATTDANSYSRFYANTRFAYGKGNPIDKTMITGALGIVPTERGKLVPPRTKSLGQRMVEADIGGRRVENVVAAMVRADRGKTTVAPPREPSPSSEKNVKKKVEVKRIYTSDDIKEGSRIVSKSGTTRDVYQVITDGRGIVARVLITKNGESYMEEKSVNELIATSEAIKKITSYPEPTVREDIKVEDIPPRLKADFEQIRSQLHDATTPLANVQHLKQSEHDIINQINDAVPIAEKSLREKIAEQKDYQAQLVNYERDLISNIRNEDNDRSQVGATLKTAELLNNEQIDDDILSRITGKIDLKNSNRQERAEAYLKIAAQEMADLDFPRGLFLTRGLTRFFRNLRASAKVNGLRFGGRAAKDRLQQTRRDVADAIERAADSASTAEERQHLLQLTNRLNLIWSREERRITFENIQELQRQEQARLTSQRANKKELDIKLKLAQLKRAAQEQLKNTNETSEPTESSTADDKSTSKSSIEVDTTKVLKPNIINVGNDIDNEQTENEAENSADSENKAA